VSAIVEADKALSFEPQNADALFLRGSAYYYIANKAVLDGGPFNMAYMKKGVDDMKKAAEIDQSYQKNAQYFSDEFEKIKILMGVI